MPATRYYQNLAAKREKRVRAKLHGTAVRPRLNIFRSNQHTYLQVINDDLGLVLAAVNTMQLDKETGTKTERAVSLTQRLMEKLQDKKIKALVLDRGSYRYHGRIKAIAEALRAGKIEV